MKLGFWIISLAAIVKLGDANPNILTPFGRCKEVPHVKHFDSLEIEGIWFLQLTPDIPEHNSPYTCQTSFEYVLAESSSDVILSVNMFYASNGKTVREPIYYEFLWDPFDNVFKAGTNIDGNDITLYLYVLNLGLRERISYMCTDSREADSDRTAVYLWSRVDNPPESILDEAIDNITSIFYPELIRYHLDSDSRREKRFQMNRVNQMADECDTRMFYTDGSRYLKELYLKLHSS